MRIIRIVLAYIAATAVAYALASAFFTQRVLAGGMGAYYTPAQQAQTYYENFLGLAPAYGVVVAVALLLGFVVAAGVKRIVKPLAPIAYPVAGAAAIFAALWLIEYFKGAGALSGAKDALGVGLQCLAGLVGGVVFALARGRPR